MKNVQEVCKTGKVSAAVVVLQEIPVKNEIQTIKRRKRDEIDTKLNRKRKQLEQDAANYFFSGKIMLFCIFMQIYLQIPNNFPNSKFAYF